MKIRSQQYAQKAYVCVEKVKAQPETVKEYRTLALTFPNMVLQSGLCQAVGFLLAKGESHHHHKQLLKHLTDLLNGNEDYEKLHRDILKADLTEYQLLTRKALEAAAWLKRYTQALLPNPNDNKKE